MLTCGATQPVFEEDGGFFASPYTLTLKSLTSCRCHDHRALVLERLFWLEQCPRRHEPVCVKVVVEHDRVAPLVRGVLAVGGTVREPPARQEKLPPPQRRALHSTYVTLSHLKTVSVDKSALNSCGVSLLVQ